MGKVSSRIFGKRLLYFCPVASWEKVKGWGLKNLTVKALYKHLKKIDV